MTRQRTPIFLLSLAVWLSITADAHAQVLFRGLGDLPGGVYASTANAVSADGSTVVGASAERLEFAETAFRWRADTGMVSLGRLPHPFDYGSIAYAVSADGSIVVGEALDQLNEGHPTDAFMWTEEQGIVSMKGAMFGGLYGSEARAISDDGSVVAGASDRVFATHYPAARWTLTNGWERLGPPLFDSIDIGFAHALTPDGRVFAVTADTQNYTAYEAFMWSEKTGYVLLGDLPGGAPFAVAKGISADGAVVVGYSSSVNSVNSNYFEAFRWNAVTGMQGLGDLPGGAFFSMAHAVSRDGRFIYGRSTTTLPGGGAFVWDEKHGMRQLAAVLHDEYGLDLAGWRLSEVTAISADGRTLVGNGTNPAREQEAWIIVLPPPCPPDFNADATLNSQDFFDYLIAFFGADIRADFNRDSSVNSQDFFDFLTAFFAGCE